MPNLEFRFVWLAPAIVLFPALARADGLGPDGFVALGRLIETLLALCFITAGGWLLVWWARVLRERKTRRVAKLLRLVTALLLVPAGFAAWFALLFVGGLGGELGAVVVVSTGGVLAIMELAPIVFGKAELR